jgi:penicillin-binding protein 1C
VSAPEIGSGAALDRAGASNGGRRRRALIGVSAAGGLIAALALALWLAPAGVVVPSFDVVRSAWRPSEARVLDRHGEVIHETRTDPKARRFAWMPVFEVSPVLVAAVLASEDRRFHEHQGVDARALLGAALGRLRGAPPRGGSTITMQLAARFDASLERGTGPRTLLQKARQMRAAWAIEARWSKAQVLEAYLNLATFRGELQGVGAAAAVLFDKAPHGLTAGEAVVLASLLRAPNATVDAVARRATLLASSVAAASGDVAAPVARLAAAERGAGPRVALAPHAAARLLRAERAGATVVSALDLTIQRLATDALRRQLTGVRGQHVQDGTALVVDNATGEVLAYVGSSGDLASARFVDGVQARRQAGSTLKPFLYAVALGERLLTPASLLDDSPLEIAVTGGLYRPHNYDEHFRGRVSVRAALASSLNVPAVRTLGLVGGEAFVAGLRRFGFDGLRESGEFYGPALALGSGDVSLWELTGAYRALANDGVWSPLRLGGDERMQPRRAVVPAAAFLVADVLADREARSATFGLENPLATRFWTAVKTGTSRDMRDNWCVGFSRRYTVGVWVGNFSGEPMWNVSGVTGAAPAWLEIMNGLHRQVPSEAPPRPAGVVRVPVRFAHGIEPARPELFLRGTEPLPAPSAPGAPRAASAPAGSLAPAAPAASRGPVAPAGSLAPAAPAASRGLAAPAGSLAPSDGIASAASEPDDEPRVAVVEPATSRPRIVAPTSGTIVAIDPGIPATRQRMLFEARAGGGELRWTLDGVDLGAGSAPLLWAPRAGRHRLALVDGEQRVRDVVEFLVRGAGGD